MASPDIPALIEADATAGREPGAPATPTSHVRDKLVTLAVIVLVINGVGASALTVRRELSLSLRRFKVPQSRTEADWLSYATAGHVFRPADAPPTIVEFADFQCSFYRVFKTDVDVIRSVTRTT